MNPAGVLDEAWESRCYFRVPAATNAIVPEVACGPVLTPASQPDDAWTRIRLAGRQAENAGPGLTDGDPSDPGPRPVSVRLLRPDGKKPPKGTGGLVVPLPPPQSAGAVLFGGQITQALPTLAAPPVSGDIVGWDTSISVTGLGSAPRLGQGPSTLVPAQGQHFVLASLAIGRGSAGTISQILGKRVGGDGSKAPNATLKVMVDGQASEPLDMAKVQANGTQPSGEVANVPLVASVPDAAKAVSLDFSQGKLSGSIDLLTGRVISDVPAVVSRRNVNAKLASRQELSFIYKGAFSFSVPRTDKVTYTTGPAFLTYFDERGGPLSPSADQATLVVYLADDYSSPSFSLRPEPAKVNLVLPTGQQVIAIDGATAWGSYTTAGQVFLFTVPADFTAGSFTMRPGTFEEAGITASFNGAELVVPITITTS